MKRSARPKVIANFALTADGKVSTHNFTSAGFTSPRDKTRLREIRSLGDAVLVGAGTVAADTMSMTLSVPALRARRTRAGLAPEPLRVIVSRGGSSLHAALKVFRTPGAPIVVFTGRDLPEKKRSTLSTLCDLWIFEDENVSLEAILQILKKDYSVKTLVCEGGPSLFRSLLEIQALDELHLTIAPLIFGGAKAPTITGLENGFLPKALQGRLAKMETRGSECFLKYLF